MFMFLNLFYLFPRGGAGARECRNGQTRYKTNGFYLFPGARRGAAGETFNRGNKFKNRKYFIALLFHFVFIVLPELFSRVILRATVNGTSVHLKNLSHVRHKARHALQRRPARATFFRTQIGQHPPKGPCGAACNAREAQETAQRFEVAVSGGVKKGPQASAHAHGANLCTYVRINCVVLLGGPFVRIV
jgi:hypothetical protein